MGLCGTLGTHWGDAVSTNARAILDAEVKEKDFQADVRRYAELHGWKVAFTWSSKHSPSGWPDLFMARDGEVVTAELKTEAGKTTWAQRDWLRILAGTGKCRMFLWRPSSWRQIEAVLGEPKVIVTLYGEGG